MSRLFASVSLLVLAVALQTASALDCWKCSSDIDRACNDRFNMTDRVGRGMYNNNNNNNNYNSRQNYDPNYNQNYNPNYNPNYNNPNYNNLNSQTPYLERCDDNDAALKRMKNVCIKKTIKGNNYVSIVRRCAMIGMNEGVGTCHDPVSRGLSLDFCEYCDYDGCNSASSFKINILLASLLPIVSFLIYRH